MLEIRLIFGLNFQFIFYKFLNLSFIHYDKYFHFQLLKVSANPTSDCFLILLFNSTAFLFLFIIHAVLFKSIHNELIFDLVLDFIFPNLKLLWIDL